MRIAIAAPGLIATAQVSATIDIDATRTTPLNSHFSGFNDEVVFPPEYFDFRLANAAGGMARVAVLHGSATALTGSLNIAASAPGLHSMNSDGAGVAAALALRVTAANQTVNETVYTCNPPAARSCLGLPLSLGGAGDTLSVELFGIGIRGAASVGCFVAGQSVPVLYAGQSSFAGEDQVNITVPPSLAGTGTALVYLVADGGLPTSSV